MARHLITVAVAGLAAVVTACGASQPGQDVTPVAPLASTDEASALQQRLVSVVKAVSPSVVQIRTPEDLGSGVVFDARGDIVPTPTSSATPRTSSSPWPPATATPRPPSAATPPTTSR